MSSTNQYRDTHAEDYLNDVRLYLAEQRAKATSATDRTLTSILQLKNQVNLTNPAPTATAQTLGDYDIVDNTGKLVGYYPFDLDVNDHSNANHGTVTGTEQYSDGPLISSTHRLRKGFLFDGSTRVELANESSFDIFDRTTAWSVSFWLSIPSSGATAQILAKQTTSAGQGFGMWKNSADLLIGSLSNTSTTNEMRWSSSTNVGDGIFRHIGFTHSTGTGDSSEFAMYVDADPVGGATVDNLSSSCLNASPFTIGSLSTNGNSKVPNNTIVSQLQIWNVELTQSDMDRLSAGKQVNRDTTATNPAYFGFADIT